MEKISAEDLKIFMEALGLSSKSELGKAICDVSLGSINGWIRDGKLPQFRLDLIASAVAKKIWRRTDLTPSELAAKQRLEKIYATPLDKMVEAAVFIKVGRGRVKFVTRSRAHELLVSEIQGSSLLKEHPESVGRAKAPTAGIALNSLSLENIESATKSDKDALDTEPGRVQPFSNEIKHDQFGQLLSAVSLEELLREIGRRGFKVQIEPKE